MIPDDLPVDLARIGEVLERHDVRYLVVGGMSGTFHAMVHYRTHDVDLLVHDGADNLDRLAAALTELGAVAIGSSGPAPISGADLAIASTQWDTQAGPVDVLITVAWTKESIVVYTEPRTWLYRDRRGAGRHDAGCVARRRDPDEGSRRSSQGSPRAPGASSAAWRPVPGACI